MKTFSSVFSTKKSTLFSFFFTRLLLLAIVLGFLTRIVLILTSPADSSLHFLEVCKLFVVGTINDVAVGIISLFFIWVCLLTLSNRKYKAPWSYLLLLLWSLLFCYTFFFNTIFDEYGSVVPKIAKILFSYKLISYTIRLFVPAVRHVWSKVCVYVITLLYVLSLLLIATSEYFFWDEFGVRFNFIAVDYLIYTNEVIGNIMESYPIIPLFTLLCIVALTITYFMVRNSSSLFKNLSTGAYKLGISLLYILLSVVSYSILSVTHSLKDEDNIYVNELQANGSYKFCDAFVHSELSYPDFYRTISKDEAMKELCSFYGSTGAYNLHFVQDSVPEVHKNIVLITVESLSASFMAQFGNKEGLTPYLDQLAEESLFFTQLYATGNRTVRGLEALTLCTPPTPGGSVVKQKNNQNLFTTGALLKERGYSVQFFYGGDSYFDNMKTFFEGNGYDIVDKKNFAKDEVTFSNIWGVCDEDMYNKALKELDENSKTNRPFFAHIMTTSNHRPFTYPEGKIDISAQSKSRAGGVKYTDYAIGKFIEAAKQKPWFNQTVFIIVADHCASSSGKTSIPLDKYHIPALIYAPGYIEPQRIDHLTSQIDVMPTLFGLLHFSYPSYFYGCNVLSPHYISKAFIATYQNLGYLEDDVFTILSPIREVEQHLAIRKGNKIEQLEQHTIDKKMELRSIAHYQTVSARYIK